MAPPIVLSLPARAAPAAGLETRPRQVRRWIETLPLNVTFETGRKLLGHVEGINASDVDLDARLDILDAHRAAGETVLRDLEARYACAELPLGPGPRAALGLARELLTAMALGYRIAIVEASGRRFGSRRQLRQLVHRALQYTVARMHAAYKSYTPVPTGTWAELHELFLTAERLGFAGEAGEGDAGAKIVDLYAEALLLSLTDPYRLGPGEAERVLQILAADRGLATLSTTRPATAPGGHFVVPCNTDKPPKPSIGKLDDAGGPDGRLLDANALVARLRGRAATARGPDAELLARLQRLWGDPPKRTSRRDPGQATVAIVMGIESVGHFVSLSLRVDHPAEDAMLRSGITMPLMPLPVNDQSDPIPVFEWEIVNESRGGLRVRRRGRTEQPIAVGEVAGIRMAGRPHWAIGVVRWLTVFEDGGMEFGLQFLAPMARAVEAKGWGVPSGHALLLVDEAAPAALLTSPHAFSHLAQIEIEDQGDACLVTPGRVLEVTARYELFEVKAP